MADTLTYTARLTQVTCWCGIRHAIPSDLHQHSRADSSFVVYCPLGHQWVTKVSETDRLRKQLEQAEAMSTHLRDQRDATERSLSAQRGENTKLRKRIAGGACPCCKRSFVDLGRHMKGQHPNFTTTAGT